MNRAGLVGASVSGIGLLFLYLCMGAESDNRPTFVPAAKIAKARRIVNNTEAPPIAEPTPVDSADAHVAQLGRAMGGYLVACDPKVHPSLPSVVLPSGRFWLVPRPEGAAFGWGSTPPDGSPRVESGFLRWEGASETQPGRCFTDRSLVSISGHVEGVSASALFICNALMSMDRHGNFEGHIPRDTLCDVSVIGHEITPSIVSAQSSTTFDLQAHRDTDFSGIGLTFQNVLNTLGGSSHYVEPGPFEIAYENSDGLSPETVNWLADKAAMEIVQGREMQRQSAVGPTLVRLLTGLE